MPHLSLHYLILPNHTLLCTILPFCTDITLLYHTSYYVLCHLVLQV